MRDRNRAQRSRHAVAAAGPCPSARRTRHFLSRREAVRRLQRARDHRRDPRRRSQRRRACCCSVGSGLYDELQSILVYPGAFWVEDEVHDDDGLVTHRRRELSGEAWDSHRIILSWEDIERDRTPSRRTATTWCCTSSRTTWRPKDAASHHSIPPLPPTRERSAEGRVRAAAEAGCGPWTPGTRTWSPNSKRSATRSIAASRRFSIPTPPRTRTSSSRSSARNSSSARPNCARRIRVCMSLLREFYGIDPAPGRSGAVT